MEYKILATGSTGNAILLNNNILIDLGVPFAKIEPYYKDIDVVLLTHIHSDHFNKSTIKKLAKLRPTVMFVCHNELVNDLESLVKSRQINIVDTGSVYDFGAFEIITFDLIHDVKNIGYTITFNDGYSVFYATDTGHLDNVVAKACDLYLIEANYCENAIINRIENKINNNEFIYEKRVFETHLSKQQADKWISENASFSSKIKFIHQHKGGHND